MISSSTARSQTGHQFEVPAVTELLSQLISIPSVNPMGRDLTGPEYFETRMSDWLCAYFESLGVAYERIPVAPGRDNVVAHFVSDPAAPTILLDAHQDTVPVEGMTVEPFAPMQQEGRIYGRGACDVKGGLAAMLHAFTRLVVDRPAAAANVILSCTCDEESTMLGVIDLIAYWNGTKTDSTILATKPDAAIIAEPTELDIVVAHRGVVRFRVRTIGIACHSSDPTQGDNAIYSMSQLLTTIADYANRLPDLQPPHPLCGPATLSVGRIEGGSSVNIVPEHCAIEIDRRVIPGEDPLSAIEHLRAALSVHGDVQFEIDEPWINCPALSDADNGPLASALVDLLSQQEVTHHSGRAPQSVGVPYGTHASTVAAVGIPAVVFGPGSIAQAHTKDEWIAIDSLETAANIYYELCCNPTKCVAS